MQDKKVLKKKIKVILKMKCHFCYSKHSQYYCGGCYQAAYCSRNCQSAAWKVDGHQLICNKNKREREDEVICIDHLNTEYCFDASCLPETFHIGEKIGEGLWGAVYRVTIDGNTTQSVIKIVSLLNSAHEVDFLKEAEIARLMGEYDIGPTVHNTIICNNVTQTTRGSLNLVVSKLGFIVMDFVGISLRSYLDSGIYTFDLADIKQQIVRLAKEMTALGYQNDDLQTNNVTIDEFGNVRFIDFGYTYKSEDANYLTLIEDIMEELKDI